MHLEVSPDALVLIVIPIPRDPMAHIECPERPRMGEGSKQKREERRSR
jgi:hypothetical protein